MVQTLQGANWQRAGGKGNPPERIERPTETRSLAIKTSDELKQRRAAYDAELKRRRARRNKTQRKGA
jgi:uncharacterized small protein (DUF1192 family)